MNSGSILSRQTLALGECVRPIASKFRARMESRPKRSEQVTDILSYVRIHMELIQADIDRFVDDVNRLGELLGVADTSEHAVQRGAARVEICLERLLDDYDEVRRAIPGSVDSEGCRLLEQVYREALLQIQGWLDDLLECLNNPMGALEKRGLTLEEGRRLPITLDLELGAPPSLTDMDRWIEQRADALFAAEEAKLADASARTSRRATGCLGLLATFGLGWWLGGNSEDCEDDY